MIVNYGCLANAHGSIRNIGVVTEPEYRPTLDRRTDPGAGAFSDFEDVRFYSLHPISAGDELFLSYGPNWYVPMTL